MVSDQKLDQLERLARLLCERPLYPKSELRKQSARLGDYVNALQKYDAAKLVAEESPNDWEANHNMAQARETLDLVREELKRHIRVRM